MEQQNYPGSNIPGVNAGNRGVGGASRLAGGGAPKPKGGMPKIIKTIGILIILALVGFGGLVLYKRNQIVQTNGGGAESEMVVDDYNNYQPPVRQTRPAPAVANYVPTSSPTWKKDECTEAQYIAEIASARKMDGVFETLGAGPCVHSVIDYCYPGKARAECEQQR